LIIMQKQNLSTSRLKIGLRPSTLTITKFTGNGLFGL
jgi:hypothetical protein